MPELPEVETVRLTLEPLVARKVSSVWSSGKALRLGSRIPTSRLRNRVVGHKVTALRRIGKYLLIDFHGQSTLLVHLGMSGRLRLQDAKSERAPHTHLVMTLSGRPSKELPYSDPRRFGQIDLFASDQEAKHPALRSLGPDPLTTHVSGEELHRRLHRRKAAIKTLLLDQKVIAGVGNIYASEALHVAGIRPTLAGTKLSKPRANKLAAAVREVLTRALSRGGTSLRDFVDADGHKGDNSHYLWVYDREGQACPRRGCDGVIRRTVMGQRATFHCPRCQRG